MHLHKLIDTFPASWLRYNDNFAYPTAHTPVQGPSQGGGTGEGEGTGDGAGWRGTGLRETNKTLLYAIRICILFLEYIVPPTHLFRVLLSPEEVD